MKIQINHLAKMEGHASFIGALENGDVTQAKIITEEGVRLVEGCLKGKSLYDAHVITMRICGICPIVHNLAAIKAMENALNVRVSLKTVSLRKLMELGQLIHSHSMHLFFLSLPDFLNNNETVKLIKKYPKEAKMAMSLREFGNQVNQIIGGRAIHPLNNWIGGFKVLPNKKEIIELSKQSENALKEAIHLAEFFSKLKYPKFERKTEFVSLFNLKEYAIYDGAVMMSKGKIVRPYKFYKKMQEVEESGAMAKRALWYDSHFMVGALARVNNHGQQLNREAKKIWRKIHGNKKVYNSFYNVLAQAVEVVHCIEEIRRIINNPQFIKTYDRILVPALAKKKKTKVKKSAKSRIRTGYGVAAVEAPRGILIHAYQINRQKRIVRGDIITPTVMFLGNLEDDLTAYLPQTKNMTETERRNKIRTLIRAYDPCISCATH